MFWAVLGVWRFYWGLRFVEGVIAADLRCAVSGFGPRASRSVRLLPFAVFWAPGRDKTRKRVFSCDSIDLPDSPISPLSEPDE